MLLFKTGKSPLGIQRELTGKQHTFIGDEDYVEGLLDGAADAHEPKNRLDGAEAGGGDSGIVGRWSGRGEVEFG
jgi:hypothetical protein